MGLSIGGILGKVEKVDVGENGLSLGCYLRIKVVVDVSQPLIKGRLVHMGGSDSRWVEFKYERLPVLCYLCDRLDHDEKDCIEWMRRTDPISSENKQYGPWLRANPDRLQKMHTVMGQQTGASASPGQTKAEMTEREGQHGKQSEAPVVHRQLHGDVEIIEDRADMESMILEGEKTKEKLNGEKEKLDFEE